MSSCAMHMNMVHGYQDRPGFELHYQVGITIPLAT